MIDSAFLRDRFNIHYLKPYQELIIDYIMNKPDGRVLGVLPTGSGKSLCFMYPIAYSGKKSLLIYPLKSLMNDQKKRFDRAGISSVVLCGGLDQEERLRRIRAARAEGIAIITNIETILSMRNSSSFSIFANIPMMIIDEAHTSVTWGSTFRSSFLSLPSIIRDINPKMILAFTATLNREIGRGIRELVFLGNEPYVVRASSDRDNIFYHSVHSLSKTKDLIKILTPPSSRPAIIFCRSRNDTEKIAVKLSGVFDVRRYHAGLDDSVKKETEEWFLNSCDGVLSSTSAYGMGVDKENIRTVIHLSLPDEASSFLQEAGRGGRDGRRMDSYVLWQSREESDLSDVFKKDSCIRCALLRKMDEDVSEEGCVSCSSCVPDGYIPSGMKEIMCFIIRHPLMRKEDISRKIRRKKLKDWSSTEIAKAIDELILSGLIRAFIGHLIAARKKWYNFFGGKER